VNAVADLIVEHGIIVTMDKANRVIHDGAMAVEEGRIIDVGQTARIKKQHRANQKIDAHGKAVLPGLINAHTHLSERLLPGISDDLSLYPWLREVVWPGSLRMRREDCYWAALLGCIEMVKSGITCFSDMFVHLGNIMVLDQIAQAVSAMGIRGVLSRGIMEYSDTLTRGTSVHIALQDTLSALKKYHGKENRLFVRFGPTITFQNSPELLQKIKALASEHQTGIHIHIAETYDEVRTMKKEYGKRTVRFLHDIDFLGPDVLAAHCIWLTEEEIMLLRKHDVKVVYNPTSNMKLGDGVAPISEILKEGITVALGSDGSASSDNMDMITVMRIGSLLQKVHYLNPVLTPSRVILRMATCDGARALQLEDMIGSIEIGKKADLALIDLNSCNMTPVHDVIKQIVYSGHSGNVSTTIIDGKVVMENRNLTSINEDKVFSKCQKIAENIYSSLSNL